MKETLSIEKITIDKEALDKVAEKLLSVERKKRQELLKKHVEKVCKELKEFCEYL